MSDKLPNCRALVGPWSHNWPDTVVPGPNIAFMDECLRFWDEHLKGVTPGRDISWAATPLVRWFHCDGVMRPGPAVTSWPGRWRSGPASQGSGRTVFRLGEENKLTSCEESASPNILAQPVSVSFSGESSVTHLSLMLSGRLGSAGLFCGEWLSFGAPDLANDQRSVAAYHACWTSEPLQQPLHVFGRCEVDIRCRVDTATAHVYLALCHVMNTNGGGYRLLTYGVQNLNGQIYALHYFTFYETSHQIWIFQPWFLTAA